MLRDVLLLEQPVLYGHCYYNGSYYIGILKDPVQKLSVWCQYGDGNTARAPWNKRLITPFLGLTSNQNKPCCYGRLSGTFFMC